MEHSQEEQKLLVSPNVGELEEGLPAEEEHRLKMDNQKPATSN